MSSIKISQAGKGKYHWEKQLLKNQKARMEFYLHTSKFDVKTKIRARFLFDALVDKDNIVALHTHPINRFVDCLLNYQLRELMDCSSSWI